MKTANARKPLVTVGITSYNAQDTIENAINSALNQHWPNLELIIVDDCSTDNSIIVINKLISSNKSATLVKHKYNKGVAASRQSIIDHAQGEFIVFF